MQCSMIQIHEYFNCHLQRRLWQQLPSDIQLAAVKMAEEDIMLALGCETLDIGDLLIFCAICEQALYLAISESEKNKATQSRGALKSETIEGIGKREYYETCTDTLNSQRKALTGTLAPRSELFLSRLPKYNDVRFSRG